MRPGLAKPCGSTWSQPSRSQPLAAEADQVVERLAGSMGTIPGYRAESLPLSVRMWVIVSTRTSISRGGRRCRPERRRRAGAVAQVRSFSSLPLSVPRPSSPGGAVGARRERRGPPDKSGQRGGTPVATGRAAPARSLERWAISSRQGDQGFWRPSIRTSDPVESVTAHPCLGGGGWFHSRRAGPMQTVHVQSQTGSDGILHLEIPVGLPNADVEVVLVIQPRGLAPSPRGHRRGPWLAARVLRGDGRRLAGRARPRSGK